MNGWWNMIPIAILGLMVVIAVALVYGSHRWQSATAAMHVALEAARLPIEPRHYDAQELEGLPAPVQHYFRAVLQDGQAMISAVSVAHAGTFNTSETGEQWKPFTSTQRVITQRPGFDWEGRIAMLPGLTVRVHDAYIAGEGILHATLFGLVSLVNLRGTPEVAQGELMRFPGRSRLVSDGPAAKPGSAMGSRRRDLGQSDAEGRRPLPDATVPLQRKQPDRIGARRGARTHCGRHGGSDTVGRPMEPLRTARRDAGPHRRRGGVDASRGAKTLLARAHYPARL